MANKNWLLAIFFIMGFILFWDHFIMSRYGPPSQQTQEQTPPSPAMNTEETEAVESLSTLPPINNNEESKPTSELDQEAVLESDGVEVRIGTKGGRVLSWKIKENESWIELVNEKQEEDQGKDFIYPLETFSYLNFDIQSVSDNAIVLSAVHPQGFRVTKKLALGESRWLHDLSFSVTNTSNRLLAVQVAFGWGEGIGKTRLLSETEKEQMTQKQAEKHAEQETKQRAIDRAEIRGVALSSKIMSWKPGFLFDRSIDRVVKGSFDWAGVDNDHFLASFIPVNQAIDRIHVKADKKTAAIVQFPFDWELRPGETQDRLYKLFVGPKSMSVLKETGHRLYESVNYGFFGIISKLLLQGLSFFKSLTGNYGWAIIILTVCVQIIFLPLTRKSLQFSIKMKEIQPQMAKLKEKFKSDPKRMQIETLNLYRRNGMKFMGMEGCFPMLIQIPIFFAFYQTLRVAYELRGAPWILWIKDLAVYDPSFILPVVMGLGMLAQQKLTAVATDPTQAKMMYIMPIMFTFFFLKLPAGLVLYWVVNSITTIVFQRILQWTKLHHPKPTPS